MGHTYVVLGALLPNVANAWTTTGRNRKSPLQVIVFAAGLFASLFLVIFILGKLAACAGCGQSAGPLQKRCCGRRSGGVRSVRIQRPVAASERDASNMPCAISLGAASQEKRISASPRLRSTAKRRVARVE